MLTACSPGASGSLQGVWSLVSYGDPANPTPAVPDVDVFIEFQDGQLGGNVGCNGFGGDYTIEGETIGWAVGMQGTILHSADGGSHWVQQTAPTGDDFRGVFFVSASVGWATSVLIHGYDHWGGPDDWRSRLWHTGDGGASWVEQSLPGVPAILTGIDFVDANTGWVVGVKYIGEDEYGRPAHRGAIYHTTDGGASWMEQTYAAEEVRITFTAVDFIDALQGWAAGTQHVFGAPGGVIFCCSSRSVDTGQ